MKTILLGLIAILLISGLALVGCTQATQPVQTPTPTVAPSETPPAQEVITWRGQYAYPLASNTAYFPLELFPGSGSGGLALKNWVEYVSGGRIQVEMAPPGSIVPVADMFKAVSDGTIDVAGGMYGGYYTAQVPETDIEIGLPYAWPNAALAWDWYYLRGGIDMFQEVYGKNNIYFMPLPMDGVYSFASANFDISQGLASIKGKKIRALGIYGDLIQELGGSPVVVPGPDMYMALKLGTVDGSIYGLDSIDAIKLGEVWKQYVVDPNLNNTVVNNLINKKKWDALPPDLKDLLNNTLKYRLAGSSLTGYTWVKYWAAKYPNVKLVGWPDADKAEVKKIAVGLWDKIAAKTPMAGKMVESIKQQQRELGLME